MKILFAVSNENVSNKIVDSYQKKYGEAVSYKNVFYFNAIIREIHKDKTYDRIVISEDLEPFSNNNYDVIDKFILERLKEISYEISSQDKFIDVVVICTDRRTKAGYVLSKMYEYGIYNALVGTDRRIDNVCSLLYNPRTQQEAKEYYNIESQVDTSSVDDVSEQEVQNILIHYKRLGKNEDRYTDSFNNIAAQYTDKQLKIIIKCLPINVRAVLEAECPKYQELVTYAEETEEEKAQKAKLQEQRRIEQIENEKKLQQKIEKEKRETERNAQKENQLREKMQSRQPVQTPQPTASGIDLLDNKRKEQRMTGNVIIPTNMNIRNERKIYTDEELNNMAQQPRQQRTVPQQQVAQPQSNSFPELDQIDARAEQPVQQPASTLPGLDDFDAVPQQPVQQPTSTLPGLDDFDTIPQQPVQQSQDTVQNLNNIDANIENSAPAQIQMEAVASQPEIPQEPKRGRGRPRKNPTEPPKPKGKRGRPRKNPLPEDQIEDQKMPAIDEFDNIPQINTPQPTESMAQTSDNINTANDWNQDPFATQTNNQQPASTLPGTNDWDADPFATPTNNQQPASTLPGTNDWDADPFATQTNNQQPASTLPGTNDWDADPFATQTNNQQPASTLPGTNDWDADPFATQTNNQQPASTLPGTNDWDADPFATQTNNQQPASTLPGTNDWDADPFATQTNNQQPANTLPGTNDWDADPFATPTNNQQPASTLPGTNDWDADPFATNNNDGITLSSSVVGAVASAQPDTNNDFNNAQPVQEEKVSSYTPEPEKIESMQKIEENRLYSTGSLNSVLTKDKKIVAFVGASKNGTSFLVNNLACLFSSIGVKTAILDMTQNKNSYYIYTNNDERLRNIAYTSIENLENGIAEGIQVDRNLNVYTAIPNDGKDYSNAESILSTLVQNESLVLIDCDLKTDLSYFANAQEIYIIQSMDILTIQPLTAFLRELKTKGILDQEKLRIVVNKELKVKSLTSKAIIGGMSFYNDPAMSYMTELFNKDKIRACSIPFDENVYSKYLEGIVNCQISINGYNKNFMNCLKMLGNMVYPLLSKQTYSSRNSAEANYGNNFSTEMNNTLNQMKNKY